MIERVDELLTSLERYDFLSAAHTWRVTLYARALAEAAGVDHETVDRVGVGAALTTPPHRTYDGPDTTNTSCNALNA